MTASAFSAFLAHMGWSDYEAARRLGAARNSVMAWKRRGAPLYIALACAALAFGLPAWREPAA